MTTPELAATRTFTVTDQDTALAVGSGSLRVLGTPRLLAWCEAVTCEAIAPAVGEGKTSVGTRISLEHLGASAVGRQIDVDAGASYVDGRLVRFAVSARMDGKLVGNGEVTRVIVDVEKFMSRL
ncbi:MAG TPA: thioesterase [Nocardioides sp.]|uniref:Putative thioesterase n=1 Tax=Nocardioides daedukensis TaxID=634462 RepID=A0A7Y9S1E8_9ACTN|nr:thioesterase [Nocardioides daedukensis]NYG60546.1 putative thioesterase [Nocardioides daedukensis]